MLIRTLMILLGVLVATASVAEEQRTLRTAYLDFKPFKYTDDQGEPAGTWVESTEMVAKEAGYEIDWVELPINRVYRYLKSGKIDFWPGMADLPELDGIAIETTENPLSLTISVFHFDDQPAITSLDELAGKNLLLIQGFTYLGVLDGLLASDTTRVSRAPNHNAALDMLARGRGDYHINYDRPAQEAIDNQELTDIVMQPLIDVQGAWIVSRQLPNARQVAEGFGNAYQRLTETGELDRIR